jgi:hypothetical protein
MLDVEDIQFDKLYEIADILVRDKGIEMKDALQVAGTLYAVERNSWYFSELTEIRNILDLWNDRDGRIREGM